MQMSVEMCAEELQLLLQLRYAYLKENRLPGTLPSSWAELTEANYAALNVDKMQVAVPSVISSSCKQTTTC